MRDVEVPLLVKRSVLYPFKFSISKPFYLLLCFQDDDWVKDFIDEIKEKMNIRSFWKNEISSIKINNVFGKIVYLNIMFIEYILLRVRIKSHNRDLFILICNNAFFKRILKLSEEWLS